MVLALKPKGITTNTEVTSVFIFIYSDCEVTSVFEAATKKTDCGTEAKTEGLISLATFFFL